MAKTVVFQRYDQIGAEISTLELLIRWNCPPSDLSSGCAGRFHTTLPVVNITTIMIEKFNPYVKQKHKIRQILLLKTTLTKGC